MSSSSSSPSSSLLAPAQAEVQAPASARKLTKDQKKQLKIVQQQLERVHSKEREWRKRVLSPYTDSLNSIINYDSNINTKKKRKDVEEDIRCITGCKRKSKSTCFHKMCFTCCHNTISNGGNYCDGHSKEEKQYQEDENLVDLALNGIKKKRPKFYHYEDKLQDKGQTCVIWCLKDFCQNKQWSGDVFQKERVEKERRLREMKRNRGRDTSSSSAANGGNTKNKDSENSENHDALTRKLKGSVITVVIITILIIITIIISQRVLIVCKSKKVGLALEAI